MGSLSYFGVEYRYIAVFEPHIISYLRILRKPQKLNYYVGETFQPDGMLLRAYYEDGTYVCVDEYHYPSEEFIDVGEMTIPISYGEGDEKKTIDLSVVIYPKQDNADNDQKDEEKDYDNTEDEEQTEGQEENDTNTNVNKTDNNQQEDTGEEIEEESNTTDDLNEKKSDADALNNLDASDSKKNDSKLDDDRGNVNREKGDEDNTREEDNDKEKKEHQKQNEDIVSKSTEDVNIQPEDSLTSSPVPAKISETENKQSAVLPDNERDQKGKGNGQIIKKNYRFKTGKLTYQITKLKNKTGQVAVIKAEKNCKTIVIPPQIRLQGYTLQVTKIGSKAFDKQARLKKVTIGKNVEIIDANAFFRCKKLQIIQVKSSKLKKVAKNAFTKIAKKHKVSVPKKCRKKYQSWIKKNHLTVMK